MNHVWYILDLIFPDQGIASLEKDSDMADFFTILFNEGTKLTSPVDHINAVLDSFESLVETFEFFADRGISFPFYFLRGLLYTDFVQSFLLNSSNWLESLMNVVELIPNTNVIEDKEANDRLLEIQCTLARNLTSISCHGMHFFYVNELNLKEIYIDDAMTLLQSRDFSMTKVVSWVNSGKTAHAHKLKVEMRMEASLIIGNLARSGKFFIKTNCSHELLCRCILSTSNSN